MSEKFCLKWNDFQSNVSKSFSSLRKEEDFYDVTLVSDDQKPISAHKVVLSSCSEYFKLILKQNNHSHPLLCLEGISSIELNNVLDYIYYGELKIHQDDLDRFLSISQRLKLEGLMADENNCKEEGAVEDEHDSKSIQYTDSWKREIDTIRNVKVRKHKTISKNEMSTISTIENFQNLEDLDARILELIENDTDGNWKCTFCGKKSKNRGHLKEHAEVHIEGLTFPCPDCDYISRSSSGLRQHGYKHKK